MPLSRRDFVKATGAAALGLGLPACALTRRTQDELMLYVGTYTREGSEGIYQARFNPVTGAVQIEGVAAETVNPSYLAAHPSGRFLYAVNETAEFEGEPGGGVSAFAVEPRTGRLTLLNRQSSRGAHPCYVTLGRHGRNLLVANYSGGNVAVLPVERDGTLLPATDVAQHTGSGADPERQEAPHAHAVVLDAAQRYAVAVDLGMDSLVVYRFDPYEGALSLSGDVYRTAPGAGPRHFVFHPNGRWAYVINELDSTISFLGYDPAAGALAHKQTVSTLPVGFAGQNSCADIHVHPTGRFLYGSNRGHDSIAACRIDGETGRLTPFQHEPTRGAIPRNFAIDPSGHFLLVANQESNTIVTFRLDLDSGRLTPTGHSATVPVPVCLRFLPPHA